MLKKSIGLAICTFKRPEGLRKLLAALPEAIADIPALEVIIVDNDGTDAQVREIAKGFRHSRLKVTYAVEPTPGISAARNKALQLAKELGLTRLAMLDDDEWPDDGWLQALLARQDKTMALVVSALVEPVFPHDSAHLEPYSRYWAVRPQTRQGRAFVHATSAILMDLEQLAAFGDLRFDDAYGLSGGGDLVFFSTLFEKGATMAWAEDALVFEDIPQQRASIDWLAGRRFRIGNHMAMEETLREGGVRTVLKTIGLCVRLPIYPLLRGDTREWRYGWRLEYNKLRGRIAAHLGTKVFEYARDGVGLRRVGGH